MKLSERLFLFLLSSTSIGSLLLYFYGAVGMQASTLYGLLPAIIIIIFWAIKKCQSSPKVCGEFTNIIFAGALATFLYDVVRMPIAMSGVPVFKAISYFGTIITGTTSPTLISEVVGWSYHFSNGLGFAIMFFMLVPAPKWWSAIVWGLLLEGAMLLTPYAEVFGYKLSWQFYLISIGGHLVYGLGLWLGVRIGSSQKNRGWVRLTSWCSLVGVGLIGWQFHLQHAVSIPSAPPPVLDEHLFVTWSEPEVDRIVSLWLLKRYVDKDAHFHFVAPFSNFSFGRSIDIPEAEIRRSAQKSAAEVLLESVNIPDSSKISELIHMANLFEISPWQLPSQPNLQNLGLGILGDIKVCGEVIKSECLEAAFDRIESWDNLATKNP